MRAETLLHKLLGNTIHQSRVKRLTTLVKGVIASKQLKLSTLGRSLGKGLSERSGIRKVDKFLANPFFQNQSAQIYQCIITRVLGTQPQPCIGVDWTKLPNTNHYALRASLLAEGRAITLYEEVYEKAKEGNACVHRDFLKQFSRLLPPGCHPILITDAGFKNPWFKAVVKQGWNFIGRVRGKTQCGEKGRFAPCEALYQQAKSTPRYLGEKLLAKKNPLSVGFYTVTQKRKGRKGYTRTGAIRQDKDSKNYSRSYREPWLLVSSLKEERWAKHVVARYRERMRIEEAFRDTKSRQYGLSLQDTITLKPKRWVVWLLLAALATFLAWVFGYHAERQGLQYSFQANSIKHRRVLSYVYLGCQLIRKNIAIPIDLASLCFSHYEDFI